MKNYIAACFLFSLLFLLEDCNKDNHDPVKKFSVGNIEPSSGIVNTVVTINGTNFGTDAGNIAVSFNGAVASVQSVTDTQIITTVPVDATTGKIVVTVKGEKADGPVFTVISGSAPSIASINPDTGTKNTIVTITGDHFGTDASKVVVLFNGTAATVQTVTNTSITAIVPAKAYTGKVSVTVNSQSVDGPVFNYVLSYVVTTIAGSGAKGHVDGVAMSAQFGELGGLVSDANGNIFIVDRGNACIREITAAPNSKVTTFAGSATGSSRGYVDAIGHKARFRDPTDLVMNTEGNLFVSDYDATNIRKISPDTVVTTLTGKDGAPGGTDGSLTTAQFYYPFRVALDAQGIVYVADGNCVRKISITEVSTLACPVTSSNLFGLCADSQGNVYVADPDHNAVQKITPAGAATKFDVAAFGTPVAIALDAQGNFYVAENDLFNRFTRIRKITPAGVVSIIAGGEPGYADGDGLNAKFKGIFGIAVDTKGNIYVSDASNYRVRKITLGED